MDFDAPELVYMPLSPRWLAVTLTFNLSISTSLLKPSTTYRGMVVTRSIPTNVADGQPENIKAFAVRWRGHKYHNSGSQALQSGIRNQFNIHDQNREEKQKVAHTYWHNRMYRDDGDNCALTFIVSKAISIYLPMMTVHKVNKIELSLNLNII